MSERRPAKGSSAREPTRPGQSGRPPQPAGTSGRKPAPRTSGRARPEGDGEDADASLFKKVMFFGTGALVLVMIVLFVIKAPVIFGPEKKPPVRKVIDDTDEMAKADGLAKKAAETFYGAKKIADKDQRNAKIQEALKLLDQAQAKYEAMSQLPRYKGEEYDRVFDEKLERIMQERKIYRDAMRM